MSLLSKFKLFLAPSIFQGVLSFITLPITTLILGPQDYGAFALVTSITGLASSVACLGAGYHLGHEYAGDGGNISFKLIVTQQIILSFCLGFLFTCLLTGLLFLGVDNLSFMKSIPHYGFLLSVLFIVPTTLWMVAVEVMTLEGKAKEFAIVTIAQSSLSVITVLLCLFLFQLGQFSLYVSACVAALIGGVSAFVILKRYLIINAMNKFKLKTFKHSVSLAGANLLELSYQALERNLLAMSNGLSSLGLYIHSQQYRSIIGVSAKALSRSVWPTTLEEARKEPYDFLITSKSWRLTHLVLAYVGLFFGLFGDSFIGLITHGKFVGAGPYTAIGIAYLLIQNMGRSHIGYIYAHKKAKIYANLNILSILASCVCVIITVPLWGAWGALLALILQHGLFRVMVQVYVARHAKIRFHDEIALIGFVLIGVTVITEEFVDLSIASRMSFFVFNILILSSSYLMFVRKLWSKSIKLKH